MTKKKFYYIVEAEILQPDGENIPVWFDKDKPHFQGQRYSRVSSSVSCGTRKKAVSIVRCLWTMLNPRYKIRVEVKKIQLKTNIIFKSWEYSWGTKYWDKSPEYFSL